MASEHPGSNASVNRPTITGNESPTGILPQASSLLPIQESGYGSYGREDQPSGAVSNQGAQGNRQQPRMQEGLSSPSDLERGMAGFTANANRQEVVPINTLNQGLGSGLPLPAPNPVRSTGAQYDAQPQSSHSTRSRSGDPFAGSPEGSLLRRSNPNLLHTRSQNGSPESATDRFHTNEVGPQHVDTNEGYGSRLRHALEGERDNVVNRLGDNPNQPRSDQPVGSRVRHVLDEERDRLVERIPGAYSRDSGNPNDGPGSRFRQALAEERENLVDHIPGGTHQGNAQGRPPNEGFGSRLRHAAQGYIHETFPSYHLPAIPGRLPHAPEGTRGGARSNETDQRLSRAHSQSVIDYVVPVQHVSEAGTEKERFTLMAGSVSSRLSATLADAESEREKYAYKAKITGLALNIAIGLQVLLGSLTTGLSAVATQGKSAAVSTTILGALATVVASYLARARGSNEPELSITRVKDLEQFIRECKNFENDHGNDMTSKYDAEIEKFRGRFEALLGNANGERKLSSTGVGS